VCLSSDAAPPVVVAYRRAFDVSAAAAVRLHVTADERYELFLDGQRVGRGPERGDPANWFYDTYDLALSAGGHCLVAKVWSMGEFAPRSQMSVRHGFLCSPTTRR
jgi:hypothetical protein